MITTTSITAKMTETEMKAVVVMRLRMTDKPSQLQRGMKASSGR